MLCHGADAWCDWCDEGNSRHTVSGSAFVGEGGRCVSTLSRKSRHTECHRFCTIKKILLGWCYNVLHVHSHDFNARLDYLLKGTDLKRTNDGTKARCVGLGLGMAWISDIV